MKRKEMTSYMKNNKTEPYLATYFHSKGRKLGLPIAGNFELTARCNFNCPMCYVHMSTDEVEKQGSELTAAEWIAIAEEAKNKGMIFALITGGEPFVRKDFFQIYNAMKAMGLIVSINSNGSLLEGEILEQLLENPPCRINVSLYGGCNETYQRMCGISAYDRVLKNIIRLKENGIDICINLSITQYNCEDIEKIYETALKHNIQVRGSSYMYPPVRLNKMQNGCGNRLSPEESAKYSVMWDRLRFTEEEFQIRAENMKKMQMIGENECIDPDVDTNSDVKCRAGSTSFWITWDGQMRPCGMLPGPTAYPLEVGFAEAWDQIRQDTSKITLPSQCATCSKKEICGVCAAVCITETGRFDGIPEYMCERMDKIVEYTCCCVG